MVGMQADLPVFITRQSDFVEAFEALEDTVKFFFGDVLGDVTDV